MSNIQPAAAPTTTQVTTDLARTAVDRVPSRAATVATPETPSAQATRPGDTLDLSQAALDASRPSDKVQSLRTEIASGTYDTDAKLDKALDRMIDSLGL